MDDESIAISAALACSACQALLRVYVQTQLDDVQAELLYPAVALHIETCATCEVAYFSEFRRQGLLRSVGELRRVGNPASAAELAQIYARIGANAATPIDWRERTLAYGRAWFDRATTQLRRWEVRLAEILPAAGGAPDLAFVGLQGEAGTPDDRLFASATLHEAQVELSISWFPLKEPEAPRILVVTVIQEDLFADSSGIRITLAGPGGEQMATTDAEGRAFLPVVGDVALHDLRAIVDF